MGCPTRRLFLLFFSLICLFGLGACKSTDDYLHDLGTLDPAPVSGREFLKEKAIVFDAGQLAHEALAGLATAESMKFRQIIASLSHACNFLGTARDKPLLQGDGAILIAVLLTRVPIPPVTEPLIDFKTAEPQILDQLQRLLEARKSLQLPGYIAALDSPDEVRKLEAWEKLKRETAEDLGRDPAAWTTWYEQREGQMIEAFVKASREPLEFLGSIRWERASEVRHVLRIFALWVQQYGRPEVEDVYVPAVLRVSRQAAVLTLTEAMQRNRDPIVRADVAEAMGQVLDPLFGDALISQLPIERDSFAAAKMIRALAAYPSRKTIENLIGVMAKEDPLISQNAADVLEDMTGVQHGRDFEAWQQWWIERGDKLWP